MMQVEKIRLIADLLDTLSEEEIQTLKQMPEFKKYVSFEYKMQKISEILKDIGMNPKVSGYYFLRDAIMMAADDSKYKFKVTKFLYPEIGRKYEIKPTCVERAIRNVILSAWENKNGEETREKIFRNSISSTTNPTNAEVISVLTEYITLYVF